jgi:hypothetical protein
MLKTSAQMPFSKIPRYNPKTILGFPVITCILLGLAKTLSRVIVSLFPITQSFRSPASKHHATQLRQSGYTILPGFIDSQFADNLKSELLKELTELCSSHSTSHLVQDKEYSYKELAFSAQPFLDVRGTTSSKDKGMYDIFNPSLPDHCAELLKLAFEANDVVGIIQAARFPWEKVVSEGCTNLYYYNSVTTPRSLHYDSLAPHFKCFLYLSDVTSEAQGAYSIVPFSHWLRCYHFGMAYFAKLISVDFTDAIFYSKKYPRKFFLKSGDLLIGDQRCVHGDTPARQGGEKIVYVKCFTYFH